MGEQVARSEGEGAGDPLTLPVQYCKGVGPTRARMLARLGIESVADLLEHFPRRYEDRAHLKPISQAVHGELETLQGVVTGVQELRPRRGLVITKVGVTDGMGTAWGVWFNQPYVARQFKPGTRVIISGRVERRYSQVQVTNPAYEVFDGEDFLHTGRIVPIYPLTEGLNARAFRSLMKSAVDAYAPSLREVLPAGVRERQRLMGRSDAYRAIHFPDRDDELKEARRRLAFEELFCLQLGLAVLKSIQQHEELGVSHPPDGELTARLLEGLPFSLTGAQWRVYGEIRRDMESPRPMHRLIQGDVGSGKTVLAALAILKAVWGGHQAALMAPTEILAEQHFRNLGQLLSEVGVPAVLLSGSQSRRAREEILAAIAARQAGLVVGTHALISDEVRFADLSLVVVDEQHRFGVRQRARLKDKGPTPDVLVMTATPIPRTLALTLYGDLDLSVLDELPPGRRPIKTAWYGGDQRRRAYSVIREQVALGRQAYVVCPLIEESEKLAAQAATELAEQLRSEIFPDLRVGLLHGRLSTEERDEAVAAFRGGQTQVLVSTTVVEVGVDVPNATVMVIEGAERFGLAQLHQLRGRVGRGSEQSYCVLVANPSSEEARERMLVMQRTSDGFAIAEEDLRLRGPGEFFGTRQHGLPDLKLADPVRDLPMLEVARREAFEVVDGDTRLALPEHRGLREQVLRRFRENLGMILVG